MAQATPFLTRFRVLASIRAKLMLILLVLTASTALTAQLAYTMQDMIKGKMAELTSVQLPEMHHSIEISTQASLTKDAMVKLMLATDEASLDAAKANVTKQLEGLNNSLAVLDGETSAKFETSAQSVTTALAELGQAQGEVLRNMERLDAQLGELRGAVQQMQQETFLLADKAYLEVREGGAEAMSSVAEGLNQLVKKDFSVLQALLEGQAEINLLSGTAIALGLTKDPATASTLKRMAMLSQARLSSVASALERADQDIIDPAAIRDAAKVLKSVIDQSLFPSEELRRAALEARRKADVLLSSAVDMKAGELQQNAAVTNASNSETMGGLLENEVGMLNRLLRMSGTLNAYQVAVLNIVAAEELSDVEAAASALQEVTTDLSAFRDIAGGALAELFDELAQLGDPEIGLAPYRMTALKSAARVEVASAETVSAVFAISEQAGTLAAETQTDIAAMANGVAAELEISEQRMLALMIGVGVVALLAMAVMYVFVSRPMNAISAATERLAGGDRSPIEGFDRSSTEIRRIAISLAVFRDGLVEKEQMEATASEERKTRRAAQEAAVGALGSGLSRLAGGDLTGRIDVPLTEGYEELRADFNRTLDTLNGAMLQIVDASGSIRNGSSEISRATDDLSHRTEAQAATLEETAAALEELTSSVKTAAEGARDVERTVGQARTEATASGKVVKEAVAAMTEIEQSSNHINQIISVIDDIAFQTNLLALNAGVEAARAGEAGRGFAVVASEVRALAQRSSDAAMEIKSLISSSSQQVADGVELVGKAGEALSTIMARVDHIAGLVSEIANGAEEQSTGLLEINTGVSQLDSVTQQNAAMVEEATAASQVLRSDAGQLAGLVDRFQTSGSAASAAPVMQQAAPAEDDGFWDDQHVA